MSSHQRDEIRWNKKGYFERYDGKKYWRKLCVIEGCMKRAKVIDWCKLHYTEQKQNSSLPQQSLMALTNSNSIISSNLFDPQFELQTKYPIRNEIRLNKHGYREEYDGFSRWRVLCKYEQCSKKAKKLSYCKRHYTEQINRQFE